MEGGSEWLLLRNRIFLMIGILQMELLHHVLNVKMPKAFLIIPVLPILKSFRRNTGMPRRNAPDGKSKKIKLSRLQPLITGHPSEIILDEFPRGGFGLGFGNPPRARPMMETSPQQEQRSFRFLWLALLFALEEQQVPLFGTQWDQRQFQIPWESPEIESAPAHPVMDRQSKVWPFSASEVSAIMYRGSDKTVGIRGCFFVLRIYNRNIPTDEGPDRVGNILPELTAAKPLYGFFPGRLRDRLGPDFQLFPHGKGCKRFQRFAVVNVVFYVHRSACSYLRIGVFQRRTSHLRPHPAGL